MINIIANNCISGYLHKIINDYKFNNPFIWAAIKEEDFVEFVKQFNEMNLSSFTEIMYKDTKFCKTNKSYYIWHRNGKNITNDIKGFRYNNGIEIIFPNYYFEWNKLKERYNLRLSRMNKNDDYIFVLFTHNYIDLSDETIQEFIDLKTPYKKVLVTSRTQFNKSLETDNLLIYNHTFGDHDGFKYDLAKQIKGKWYK